MSIQKADMKLIRWHWKEALPMWGYLLFLLFATIYENHQEQSGKALVCLVGGIVVLCMGICTNVILRRIESFRP